MKTFRLLPVLPLWLMSAAPLAAFPYAARSVATGMDTATISGSGARFSQPPAAAKFDGGHSRQWYAGGSLMTHAPLPGILQLPAILLPQTPGATVRPMASAACDVDRDGDLDVVRINEWIGNLYLYTLQVFVNDGSGTFTAGYRLDWVNAPSWNEGQHFFQIEAADFNRDGRPDLAILETYDNTNTAPNPDREEGRIIIRWNEGAGQFDNFMTVKSTGLDEDARFSVADCDRDGDPDIVCSYDITWTADGATIHIGMYHTSLFRNDGAGAFVSVDLGGRPAHFVDLNRDGWPDLADSTTVALNDRAGSFAAPVTELSTAAEAFAFTDTDHDHLTDLVRAEGNNIVAYAGNGVGGFSSTPVTLAGLSSTAIAFGVADSDADGDTDLFASLVSGGFVFLENRAFHTSPGARYSGRHEIAGVTQLHSGDFFLDGKPDIVAVTPSQEKLWFMNGSGGHIPAAPVFKNTQGESPHSAVVADFDADGRPDVAYTLPAAGEVRVARNTGSVPFSWSDTAAATGISGVSHLAGGYRGGRDGYMDLLSSSAATGQLRWHYQSGGAWSTQSLLTPFSPAPGAILAAEASTAPGDELFVLNLDSASLKLRGYHAIWGYVTLGTDRSENVSGGAYPAKLLWADVDGDGSEEAVYVNGYGNLAAWNPVTASAISFGGTPSPIRDIAAVDWDRNGRTDFLCASAYGLQLRFWDHHYEAWNSADLTATGTGYNAVTVVDLNGDGWPDAAASTSTDLHYIRNVPLMADALQYNQSNTITVNASSVALDFGVTTKARTSSSTNAADASAVCTGARVRFRRAQSVNGSWVPGADFTQSELASIVTRVRLVAGPGDTVVGSNGPDSLESFGRMQIDYHTVLGNLVPITPGGITPHGIELAVRPDALASGISRLFIQVEEFTGAPQDGLAAIAPGTGWPFRIINSHPSLVTIQPDYSPLQLWRRWYWNSPDSTGPGANDADPDNDGVPNLVEYATGTNPVIRDADTNALRALTVLPLPSTQTPVKCRLILSKETMADPKLKVTIQSGTHTGAWQTYTSRTGGGAWTNGVTPMAIPTDNDTTVTHLFATNQVPAQTPRRFFRLKVEELP